MQASTVSCGQLTEPTLRPTRTESVGSVTSTRSAPDCWKVKIRTRSPTATASSTMAVMIRGVDTATSTPHDPSNIHSFFGLFTRATVRGTPNSVLHKREKTRFALSSPVAPTTTSAAATSAPSRELSSQASARSQSASGTWATRMAAGFLSTSTTSWSCDRSSRAMDRPTEPAPAMTTRISPAPRWGRA
ncbi:hypothetical protein GCM10009809_39570 [Isoptericola hypogeus]|uniref:Uncharacterized protein n=1 Tax=Isoptericola hypogeus TaxID=300179 RepID=A0ABN2JV89_9MICO